MHQRQGQIMKYTLPIIALLLYGCAMNVTSMTNMAPIAPQSAQEALRPYYATLSQFAQGTL
jgi:hypothetical protein